MVQPVSPLSGHKIEKIQSVKDYLVSGQDFDLYHDEQWDMLLTYPVPDNLENYYESTDYKPHHHQNTSLFDRLYNFIRRRNYAYKYSLMKQYHSKMQSVLDYGTATGEFLDYLSKKTPRVSGVEPNKNARNIANKRLNNKVKVSIDDITGKYDAITLWHVLEHVKNIDELIEKLKQRLSKKGILVIAVPNFKSYDAKLYGASWAAYDVPRHLWHFSPLAIQKLFDKHEMKVIGQKPLFFDSFYVSLLSEQYKTGKKNFFKAFFTGLKSNWYARKTGQYSSLVYIIQKKIEFNYFLIILYLTFKFSTLGC